ncbi:YceD family protein [Rivibacter subsaxonicus]|uniref:Large ribosomal RNA subunit accumulation protein YceD n=1 Tax=Rivibacter subsaxonicus TaxID=457575 RepID=A0A4Q7VGT9_9BURK|nr:YceD family protein [Rivibacter subsaxonicus]RZT95261.1 uncharacterized protein EV670_3012 [Rivibacter subsaxonicus]
MAASRNTNPLRLDVAAFAEHRDALSGSWPLAELERLAEIERGASARAAEPQSASAADAVSWALHGEQRTRLGAEPETWLHVEARAIVSMECQRCLQPVAVTVVADRWLRFVPGGEEAAAALDDDSDDDVLPLQRAVDARALIEDELLLELPLVARHESCPRPLPMSAGEEALEPAADEDGAAAERPSPFAVLAQLKVPGKGH